MNRKINLLIILVSVLCLAALVFFACSKRATDPVKGSTDSSNYNPWQNRSGFFSIVSGPVGGPFSRAIGMALVEHDSSASRISFEFASPINTLTLDSAFTLVSSSGANIPLSFESVVGSNTTVNINPAVDLEYNTTYILTLRSSYLLNTAGNMLDVDGDRIAGETPDDDIAARFTTSFQGDAFIDRDHDGQYENLKDLNGDHIWETNVVGEVFTDRLPYNNRWDIGEPYVDDNANHRYDKGEYFTDNNGDSVYNSNAEPLADSNANGVADLGEFFVDSIPDSVWNAAEVFTDLNHDGRWNNTELRLDRNGNRQYDAADGDSFADAETPNGIFDPAEPFVNANHDSITYLVVDSLGVHYKVPNWNAAEAVNSSYDYDGDGKYDAGLFMVPTGIVRFNPNSVQSKTVYYNHAWRPLRFSGFTETFTDSNGDSVWNPADDFADVISNGVWDSTGEALTRDVNGNGMYDIARAGIPVLPTVDDLHPVAGNGLFYLIEGNPVATIWMDVAISTNVWDTTYDATGIKIRQALSSAQFNSTTVIVRDHDTKASVPGDVSYDNVSTSPSYLRLMFTPSSNLAAGKTYEFVLKAEQIADAAGNKLNETGDLVYTFTTTNRTSDGNTVVNDITPPTVFAFVDYGSFFTVTFSEEIDVTTINAATIAVTRSDVPNSGSFVIGRVFRAGSPTGFGTTVTFIPNNPTFNGDLAIIKASIRDLAGNRKGTNSSYNW